MLDSDEFTFYVPLKGSDCDESNMEEPGVYTLQHKERRCQKRIWFVVVTILCLAVGLTGGIYATRLSLTGASSSSGQVGGSSPSVSADEVPTRREWRTLSFSEKDDYIQAVRCLSKTQSALGLNQTLYDDFPWVHHRVGGYCKCSPISRRL